MCGIGSAKNRATHLISYMSALRHKVFFWQRVMPTHNLSKHMQCPLSKNKISWWGSCFSLLCFYFSCAKCLPRRHCQEDKMIPCFVGFTERWQLSTHQIWTHFYLPFERFFWVPKKQEANNMGTTNSIVYPQDLRLLCWVPRPCLLMIYNIMMNSIAFCTATWHLHIWWE